jgi:hypothetical protein
MQKQVESASAPSAPKRVAIVGLGPSSLNYVQYCDRHGDRHAVFDETWVVNSYVSVLSADRVFHMDDVRVQEMRAVKNEKIRGMLQALKRTRLPVYTSFPHPDYPALVAYPLQDVVQHFNSLYFNNTVAYAIAYGLFIGVKEISMFGVDFTWPNVHEAEQGRACCEYWLGRAHAMGVGVHVCETSTLMDARENANGIYHLYGYDAIEIKLMEVGPEVVGLHFSERPLPTVEEIEARYDHKVKGRPIDDLMMSFPSGGVPSGGPEVELEVTV